MMDEAKGSEIGRHGRIEALEQLKAKAVAGEDYLEAQRLKEAIEELRGGETASPNRSSAMEAAVITFLAQGASNRRSSRTKGGAAASKSVPLHVRRPTTWQGQDSARAKPHTPHAHFGTPPPKPPSASFTARGHAAEYEGVNSKLGYKWDKASPSKRAPCATISSSPSSRATANKSPSRSGDASDAVRFESRGGLGEYEGENAKLKLGWQGNSRKVTTARNMHAFDHPKTASRRSLEDVEAEKFTQHGNGAEYHGENAKLKLGWEGNSRKRATLLNAHAFDHPKTASRRSLADVEAEKFTAQGKGDEYFNESNKLQLEWLGDGRKRTSVAHSFDPPKTTSRRSLADQNAAAFEASTARGENEGVNSKLNRRWDTARPQKLHTGVLITPPRELSSSRIPSNAEAAAAFTASGRRGDYAGENSKLGLKWDTHQPSRSTPSFSFGKPPRSRSDEESKIATPATRHRSGADNYESRGARGEYDGESNKLGLRWDTARGGGRTAPAVSFAKAQRDDAGSSDPAAKYTSQGAASEYFMENSKMKLGWDKAQPSRSAPSHTF